MFAAFGHIRQTFEMIHCPTGFPGRITLMLGRSDIHIGLSGCGTLHPDHNGSCDEG